jgi:PadR family transcriptional regulator, regulatory protein PadR
MGKNPQASELLPGTLDLLILRTLAHEPRHGYGIAQRLRQISDDVLQVGESSLYPALQRLLLNGWVKAEWGASENNRRARYYTLTAAGRKQLASEREEFTRLIDAIQKVLELAWAGLFPLCSFAAGVALSFGGAVLSFTVNSRRSSSFTA